MSYWLAPEFKALQQSWYQQLKKSGFEDSEEVVGNDMLLKKSAEHALSDVPAVIYESKKDYFKLLAQHASDEKFRSEVDQYIMVSYADGAKIKDILQGLANAGEIRCRETVRFTVRRYEMKWGLKTYSRQQLNTRKSHLSSHELLRRRYEDRWGLKAFTADQLKGKDRPMSSYRVLAYTGAELPENYTGMIYAKWLRSLRYGNDLFHLIDAPSYWKTYHGYIEALLAKPACRVRLAVLTDDHDVALGFSVCRGNILDYVYVSTLQREHGIGKSLVPKEIETVTHLTNTGIKIWGTKYQHLKFNPFV